MKTLNQIEQLFQDVKQLEVLKSDIEKLVSLGEQLSSSKIKLNLNLSWEETDPQPKYEEPKEEGSFTFRWLTSDYGTPKINPKQINPEIDDYLGLRIIAFLIHDKKNQQEAIINRLKQYGYDIHSS